MKLLASALALFFVAIGAVGVASPASLVELFRPLLTPGVLYVVAAIRVVFGLLVFFAAPGSRAPRALRLLGAIIVVAGVLTPLFGVERSQAVFDWWSSQSSSFMRMWSAFAVAFGCFVIYALRPARQAAA